MRDRRGDIIYVGKAKDLKRRVSSYFRPGAKHPPKVRSMVSTVWDFEYMTVKNEAEAGGNLFAPLPLTFDGTADIANLASWSVAIDGVVTRRYKILVEEGTFRLVPRGMTIVIQ